MITFFIKTKKQKIKEITNRIFYSQAHKDIFLRRVAISKTEQYVRWINSLNKAFNDENKGEIKRRQEYLRGEGIRPPQSMADCEQLIRDLREWREL